MFKKFAIITFTLSIIIFGTEAIYRFRLNNGLTDTEYITQSNMVISAAAIVILLSAHIVKMTDYISLKAMRLIALVSIGLLCVSIALRSKYGFLMPPHESAHNVYNATSFFICITIVCWIPFFVCKENVSPHEAPSTPITQELIRRRYEQLLQRSNNQQSEVTPAVQNMSHINREREDEEILPSYHELPAPPAYSKTEAAIESNPHSVANQQNDESSSIHSNNTNAEVDGIQIPPPLVNPINSGISVNDHVSIDMTNHQLNNSISTQTTTSINQ